MTLTPSQPTVIADPTLLQSAASQPTISAWVNASAGCGKTKVLTERVMRLLLTGVKPEKILCLTYTRAGAAEMANRITATLSKWAVCEDVILDKDLDQLQGKPAAQQRTEARRLFARVLSCPGGLRIRTIHAFCQEILARFPIEAGLPPHFVLMDEQEMAALRDDVLDEILREADDKPLTTIAEVLNALVATQGEAGFGQILYEITRTWIRLMQAINAAGSEKNLINRVRALLQLAPDDSVESFIQIAMQKGPEDVLKNLAQWLINGTATHNQRGRTLSSILETKPQARAARFEEYVSLFLTQENEPRKIFADKKLLLAHPEINDISLQEALRLQALVERIEATNIAIATANIISFGNIFATRLATRKAERAVIDYDDLILFTENLLQQDTITPWISYKLDQGLDHILVDEAQDTSNAQWHIVQSLTTEFFSGESAKSYKNRTLFVVGDEKQSIFSFQNADPSAFLALRETFSQRLLNVKKKLEIIPMHTSFRSAPAILRAVDKIYENSATRQGVSPDPIQHNAYNRDKVGRVEIWPLIKEEDQCVNNNNSWIIPVVREPEHDPQAELAQRIAKKIKSWLTQQEILAGTNHPIVPGDIMILLRRRGRLADLLVRALKSCHVPVTGIDRMHLNDQLPVMDLLSMLRFVLLPDDDLNLATLLRSPLIGLSEEQLMQLAIGRTSSLWHSLQTTPDFSSIRDYLSTRLNEADFSTPFVFLSHILNTACPGNADSGRKALWTRLGSESLDPIEELLNEAQRYSRTHPPSLQNFIHWLTQTDTEIKRELDHGKQRDGGQVRIMTVHAAKGLEAPIIFLPDTTDLPRTQEMPKLNWPNHHIPLFLTRVPTFGVARKIWQAARQNQIEEYRRLFYVALTRAENRLYICGWQNNKTLNNIDESWYGLARQALQSCHQDFLSLDPSGIKPEIVFADITLGSPSLPEPLPRPQDKQSLPIWASRHVTMPPITTSVMPIVDTTGMRPDAEFFRGRIIHRLLQSISDIAIDERIPAVKRFLSHPNHHLTSEQQKEITEEVVRLINDQRFAIVFGHGSLTEVPLTGSINGINVFRRVDRLCQYGDEVWVVDYKTNRPPPTKVADIPSAYRLQLEEYYTLLRSIFPNKKVRCFLLWTHQPSLMEISL